MTTIYSAYLFAYVLQRDKCLEPLSNLVSACAQHTNYTHVELAFIPDTINPKTKQIDRDRGVPLSIPGGVIYTVNKVDAEATVFKTGINIADHRARKLVILPLRCNWSEVLQLMQFLDEVIGLPFDDGAFANNYLCVPSFGAPDCCCGCLSVIMWFFCWPCKCWQGCCCCEVCLCHTEKSVMMKDIHECMYNKTLQSPDQPTVASILADHAFVCSSLVAAALSYAGLWPNIHPALQTPSSVVQHCLMYLLREDQGDTCLVY